MKLILFFDDGDTHVIKASTDKTGLESLQAILDYHNKPGRVRQPGTQGRVVRVEITPDEERKK